MVPAVDRAGGGCTIAPGKILVALRVDALARTRLARNIAHEYSHGVRMASRPQAADGYGEHVPYSVRDHLVFEGLASVLVETLYPAAMEDPEVSAEEELRWGAKADLDAKGTLAYVEHVGPRA